ncbi:4107_t:CDS:2 [Dentiscutata heterogama]|uniref:4107_t:CDS:1 n=1 Tax=Dentiscutata heterogama TaxID=1316150 RepID=A0ACA9K9N6_9GLOM|nr:4107_t:CDS:2 [Dentiscutata heterogama]
MDMIRDGPTCMDPKKKETKKKHKIISIKSASDASQQFIKRLNSNKNSILSGVIVFGLDLKYLETRRDRQLVS